MNRRWSKKTFIDWKPGTEWIDDEKIIRCAEKMTKAEGIKIIEELLNIINQWGFKGKLDLFIVCGWFLAQIVQDIWGWRPNLWVSGTQGSGKTIFSILLERLGGPLARRYEGAGSSEAGIRQDIGNNSILIILDEFENTRQRESIIELMRSSCRGGVITKGSANQTNIIFKIKHMFIVFSIEIGLIRAAEKPRFIIIETVKDVTRAPKIPTQDEIERLRIKIFSYALWASLKAKNLISHVNPIPGVDPRLLESLAVPFSMIAVCSDDPVSELNRLLEEYFAEWIKDQQGNFQEDEEKLVEDLMMANIRLPITKEDRESGAEQTVYDNRTVSQLLQSSKFSDENHTTLQTYGIKCRTGGVFIHPTKAKRMLLQNTDWAQLNIREILLRVGGATSIRDRIAGSQVRGVLIPAESLTEYLDEESHTVT